MSILKELEFAKKFIEKNDIRGEISVCEDLKISDNIIISYNFADVFFKVYVINEDKSTRLFSFKPTAWEYLIVHTNYHVQRTKFLPYEMTEESFFQMSLLENLYDLEYSYISVLNDINKMAFQKLFK